MTFDPAQWTAIAAVITAVATIVYTAGTLFLWIATRRNVVALEMQLRLLEEQTTHQKRFNGVLASNAVLDAHREIWLPVISNPKLTSLLIQSSPADADRTAAEFLASILINHCARIFQNYENKIIDDSGFKAFCRDARHLFSFPLVSWRWQSVAKYHTESFGRFIHGEITS